MQKKLAELTCHERQPQLKDMFWHPKWPPFYLHAESTYAVAWATFILASRLTISLLIVA